METTLLISIILLNVVLLGVLGFFAFIIYKLVKERNSSPTPVTEPEKAISKFHPEIQKRIEELKFTNSIQEDIFCPYHPQEAGEVQCGMCARYFCSRCVRPMKSIYFCKEHMALFLRHNWQEVLTLKTSSDDPEAGVRLIDQKQRIYSENQLPTYIETHYKIDVDSDFIETYLVLFAQEAQVEQVKEHLS